jgi:hypothetical protein
LLLAFEEGLKNYESRTARDYTNAERFYAVEKTGMDAVTIDV